MNGLSDSENCNVNAIVSKLISSYKKAQEKIILLLEKAKEWS